MTISGLFGPVSRSETGQGRRRKMKVKENRLENLHAFRKSVMICTGGKIGETSTSMVHRRFDGIGQNRTERSFVISPHRP